MALKQNKTSNADTESAKGSSQLLSLSLFIMLLAFFIVLNAYSSYEDVRVKPIMESLESTFSARIEQLDDLKPSVTPSNQFSHNEGDTIERLQALFKSQISGVEIEVNQSAGTMYVYLSWQDFKNALSSQITLEGRFVDGDGNQVDTIKFLPLLVSLIRSDQLGTPYHMDVTLNIGVSPSELQNKSPQNLNVFIEEVSSVVNRLEKMGVPKKLVTSGLAGGKTETVELFFRTHQSFNPFQISAELEAVDKVYEELENLDTPLEGSRNIGENYE
jgi:hypothetical protein